MHTKNSQTLLPPKQFLAVPNLPKASGSDKLAARVRALRPLVSAFKYLIVFRSHSVASRREAQGPGACDGLQRPNPLNRGGGVAAAGGRTVVKQDPPPTPPPN